MIKSVSSTGKYLISTYPNSPPYIGSNLGAMGVGNLRYNSTFQNIDVYDGNAWIPLITSHISIGLTSEAEDVLTWAKNKMVEEKNILSLAEKYQGIKDLKEQLDIMVALVYNSESTNTSTK